MYFQHRLNLNISNGKISNSYILFHLEFDRFFNSNCLKYFQWEFYNSIKDTISGVTGSLYDCMTSLVRVRMNKLVDRLQQYNSSTRSDFSCLKPNELSQLLLLALSENTRIQANMDEENKQIQTHTYFCACCVNFAGHDLYLCEYKYINYLLSILWTLQLGKQKY